MIEIGGRPILWHIMKMYSGHGVNDFVVLCGYKGYLIKEYFSNYFLHMSDVTFDMKNNSMVVHRKQAEPWTVTLLDTGALSNTGGRLLAAKKYIENEEKFCFTYGDGVSDIDITKSIEFHNNHGKKATITGVVPPGRYGALITSKDLVAAQAWERLIEIPSQYQGSFTKRLNIQKIVPFNYLDMGRKYVSRGDR